MQKTKGMGDIDIENARDKWNHTFTPTLNVFEEETLKNRPIGFIWPERKLIAKPE